MNSSFENNDFMRKAIIFVLDAKYFNSGFANIDLQKRFHFQFEICDPAMQFFHILFGSYVALA